MMTTTLKITQFARTMTFLASLSAPMIGCDDIADNSAAAAEATEVAGLNLEIQKDRVEGTFTAGEVTIAFVLERDGAVRTAVLSASDGSPLLESEARTGHETVTLFGGRAVLSGNPAGEPHVEGDAQAFEELKARPEAAAIVGLHAALEEAGVDPVLLGIEQADDEVTERLFFDGTWWNLVYGETYQVGTWGWITYTHIAMRFNAAPNVYACIEFQAGLGAWAKQCGFANVETSRAYQFWGALLQIKSNHNGYVMQVRTY